MASAADVPHVYDIVLNGQGYVFLDTITPNLPFRTHKATYKVSPTFIQRSNVTGAFGDNQQDWWMTASQNDWSLGEEQKFFRIGDQVSRSRYWRGMSVDLTMQGQVSIGKKSPTITWPSAVSSVIFLSGQAASLPSLNNSYFALGTTDVFRADPDGANINSTPHGLGTTPTAFCTDGYNVFVSASQATSIRKLSGVGLWSTFSPSSASSLAFVNNTLYGFNTNGSGVAGFSRWDSSGVLTTLFQWKTASGEVFAAIAPVILPFGSRILIVKPQRQGVIAGPELWTYDGQNTTLLLQMESNFEFHDMCVSEGVVFFGGYSKKQGSKRFELRYYSNGSAGIAYTTTFASGLPAGRTSLTPFGVGVLFTDPVNGAVMYFDLAAGSASTVAPFTATALDAKIAASGETGLVVQGTSASKLVLASDTASSASLQTSLFDFETSLNKLVRSVAIDFVSGTDGDGGSVDLYYTTNDVTSALASIATSITSGTEYPINVNCHAISLMIVLNKGTSTSGPTLKRIYVRSAPVLQQFRQREYVIDCTGDPSEAVRELRDGTPMPIDGGSQAASLIALSQQTTPFTITDRFGSFTGLVDLNDPEGLEVYEVHASQYVPGTSGNFVVRVKLREV